MVPKEWQLCAANDICKSISVGIVIKPSQYYVPEGCGIKAFRSANVKEGIINNSNWVYLSSAGHEVNKKSQLRKDDILIVRTGYPGTACVVTKEFEGSNAIDIIIARPNRDKVLPQYLCAFTNSEFGKAQVLSLQGGMAQKHLNVGAYQRLLVKLPPISEQKKIALILSTWDKAIESVEKLIDNSKAQKKALMQQLLTGKRRLPEFCEEWDEVSISQFGKVVTGNTPPKFDKSNFGGSISWATAESFHSKYIKNTNVKLTKSGAQKARIVPKGSVLVTCIASIGKNGIAAEDLATNQQINSIILHPYHSNEFLYYLIEHYKNKLIAWAGKTAIPILNKSSFEKIKFLTPSLEEQQQISIVLITIDKKIEILQQKLGCLKKEKKSLMQQLLTGKRRVKVDTDG